MELVYLWVEDYKNIHRQGFNFSPRFRCEFDGETLTIDENVDEKGNKQYIENFFGDNINVTAIVGKNGSGKSSVLEFIYKCFYDKKRIESTKYLIAINKDNTWHYVTNIVFSNGQKDSIKDEPLVFAYPIGLTKFFTAKQYYPPFSYLDNTLHDFNGYDIKSENIYNISEKRFFIARHIKAYTEFTRIFNQIDPMYHFDHLRLVLKNNSTMLLKTLIEEEYADESTFKLLHNLERLESIHRRQYKNPHVDYRTDKFFEFDLSIIIALVEFWLIHNIHDVGSIDFVTEANHLSEVVSQSLNSIQKIYIKELPNNPYNITQSYIISLLDSLKNIDFTLGNGEITIDDLLNSVRYIKSFNEGNFAKQEIIDIPLDSEFINNIDKIKRLQKLFDDSDVEIAKKEKFFRVFELDLYNSITTASYETISDGEKQFIHFASDIIFNMGTFEFYSAGSTILLLMDEPDNSLHPTWKKLIIEQLNSICDALLPTDSTSTIHAIFTTHSPFLLSDIPKQNIIFLDTYKKENEEVKSGDQKKDNCRVLLHDEVFGKKETFGANIHTLLSDSFFMDGLMGEFAKGKIEAIVEFLRQDELTEESKNINLDNHTLTLEKAESIISVVGEPLLQARLKKMLIDYKKKYNLLTKNDIERQIEELQVQLREMREDG